MFSCSSSPCSNLKDEDMKPEVDFVPGFLFSAHLQLVVVSQRLHWWFYLRFGGCDASGPVLRPFLFNLRVVSTVYDSAWSQFLCYLSWTTPVALIADGRTTFLLYWKKNAVARFLLFEPIALFLEGAKPACSEGAPAKLSRGELILKRRVVLLLATRFISPALVQLMNQVVCMYLLVGQTGCEICSLVSQLSVSSWLFIRVAQDVLVLTCFSRLLLLEVI